MRFISRRGKYYFLAVFIIASLSNITLLGQEDGFTVTGKVYSAETGLPLGDIGVRAVNSAIDPVSTSSEGEFEITLPNRNEQISISYPGYKEKTIILNGRNNIEVWLLGENDISISDAAVMPFREIPARDIPGAFNIERTSISHQSVNTSFCQDLQGMMPGLNVINRSGMPGEGAFMNVRGYSSLYSASLPLVVVDGMIVRSASQHSGWESPHTM